MKMFEKSVNDFSFWFPKIEKCGGNTLRIPKSYVKQIDFEKDKLLLEKFFLEHPKEDLAYIREWVDRELIPDLRREKLDGKIFVKNARFSNKFQANRGCIQYGTDFLADGIAEINYSAMCVCAGGIHEIVVREFIEYDRQNTPCIYEGLPLRSEFRVFYDFNTREPLYTVNYWDYDYCYPHLYEATDKIIFEHEREKIENAFEKNKNKVQQLVADAMKNVEGLDGKWSIDVLLDEKGGFWLIDMAVAQQSAYWNPRIEE